MKSSGSAILKYFLNLSIYRQLYDITTIQVTKFVNPVILPNPYLQVKRAYLLPTYSHFQDHPDHPNLPPIRAATTAAIVKMNLFFNPLFVRTDFFRTFAAVLVSRVPIATGAR